MKDLVVIGAGGHGRDVLDAAIASGLRVAGFVDDDPARAGTTVAGLPVLGDVAWLLAEGGGVRVVVAIGRPQTKRRIDLRLRARGIPFAEPIVHPRASVARGAVLEEGVVVLAGAAIQADARLARLSFVHAACHVGHDTGIGEWASVHPGAQIGGEVAVGTGGFVGIGATIAPRVRIGAWATVGAGAVVLRDVADGDTVVGVPARTLRSGGSESG